MFTKVAKLDRRVEVVEEEIKVQRAELAEAKENIAALSDVAFGNDDDASTPRSSRHAGRWTFRRPRVRRRTK